MSECECVCVSLTASPSPLGQSSGRATKPRVEGGEGVATLHLQLTNTEVIRSNFNHDCRGWKPSRLHAICLAESV